MLISGRGGEGINILHFLALNLEILGQKLVFKRACRKQKQFSFPIDNLAFFFNILANFESFDSWNFD